MEESILGYNISTMNIIQATKHFNIKAPYTLQKINQGIINATWLIRGKNGRFILQKMSPIFKTSLMKDIQEIQKHLSTHKYITMNFLQTNDKKTFLLDGDIFWRAYRFIDGEVYRRVPSAYIAREAGKFLGKLHRELNTRYLYDFTFCRPMKHEVLSIYKKYKSISLEKKDSKILEFDRVINLLPKLELPKRLRKNICHGDPKISNFIFNNNPRQKVITMIDFDDVGNTYNLAVEIGDALRSWCKVETGDTVEFSLPRAKASLEGYVLGSQGYLTRLESRYLVKALKLNILELATRFAIDYFKNSYFDYDREHYPSRKAHNLVRVKNSIELYHDVCRKEKRLKNIITRIMDYSVHNKFAIKTR